MNVNTSQSAVMAANSDVSSTQSQTKNISSKTSEKSFDEEMSAASKAEEAKGSEKSAKTEKSDKTEKADKSVNNDKENKKIPSKDGYIKLTDEIVSPETLSGELNFTDYKYHNESQAILTQNIQSLLNTKDIMSNVNSATLVEYDSVNMSDGDALFFANLVQNTDMSMKNIMNDLGAEIAQNSQNIQQNIKISSVLMEKLADSLKTNKPFRIDFDKDVSVIIKVNKDGSLAANFIPGDKAVEQYLKNNIASLRQRFDEENISYSELSYSNSRNGRQKHKKENNNE